MPEGLLVYIISLLALRFSIWPDWITGGLGSTISQGTGFFSSSFFTAAPPLGFIFPKSPYAIPENVSTALRLLLKITQYLQQRCAVGPLLLGKAGKHRPVLPMIRPPLILGKALHLPPIAPPQRNRQIFLPGRRRLGHQPLPGKQRVYPLETSGVGLLLLKHFPQNARFLPLKLPGKPQICSSIPPLSGDHRRQIPQLFAGRPFPLDSLPNPRRCLGIVMFHSITPFSLQYRPQEAKIFLLFVGGFQENLFSF